jgi:hypothetical protein
LVAAFLLSSAAAQAEDAAQTQELMQDQQNLLNDKLVAEQAYKHLWESTVAYAQALSGAVKYWSDCAKSVKCWESIKPTAPEVTVVPPSEQKN